MVRSAKAVAALKRRPSGALEAEILAVLWDADAPMTAGQVLVALPGELAYTTIMTILSRLHAKGIVSRSAVGRAYLYRPVEGRAEMAAKRMADVLERTGDQSDVLSRFVARLGPAELEALKAAVRTGGPQE